jgi:hypothetical protein
MKKLSKKVLAMIKEARTKVVKAVKCGLID